MQASSAERDYRAYLAASYRETPWLWMKQQFKTRDEHDRGGKPKPFPAHKPYLEKSYKIWRAFDWLIEKKSRQLVKSWMYCGGITAQAQFNPLTAYYLSSKDEDDALKLLDRCWFAWENQEDWLKEMFPAKQVGNQIIFHHHINGKIQKSSVVEALPEGADITRGLVATEVFFDEFGFNRFAAQNLGNTLPMAEGGGRVTICCTAHPSFFEQKHVEAKRSSAESRVLFRGTDVHGREVESMVLYIPPSRDQFAALWTHYSADPEIAEKIRKVRAKYEGLGELAYFEKEYEGIAEALSGERVWPRLSRERHSIAHDDLPADFERWARYVSIDHGYRNPTAVNWIAVSPPGWRGCRDPERRVEIPVLVIYREMHAQGKSVEELYREIVMRNQGERIEAYIIDPSTDRHHGTEVRGKSVFEQFRELGLRPLLKANNDVDGGNAEVRRRLATYDQSPAMLFLNDLEHTWTECLHYRFKEMSAHYLEQNDPQEQVRAKDNHHPDAVRYGCHFRPMPIFEKPKPPGRNTFAHLMAEHARSRAKQPRNLDPRSFKGVMRRVN